MKTAASATLTIERRVGIEGREGVRLVATRLLTMELPFGNAPIRAGPRR